jgi:hypothetical protein
MPREEAPLTPTVLSSSSSTAGTPYCASAQASVRPVMPPPTMTMGWWLVSPGFDPAAPWVLGQP